MKYCFLAVVGAIALSSCSPTAPSVDQPSVVQASSEGGYREAVEGLRRVDSAVSVGLNMVEYGALLREVKPTVDAYLATSPSGPESQQIQDSMDYHLLALDWWRCDVEEVQGIEKQFEASARCRDRILPALFSKSPEFSAKVAEATEGQHPDDYKSYRLDPKAVLQWLWGKAGEGLE